MSLLLRLKPLKVIITKLSSDLGEEIIFTLQSLCYNQGNYEHAEWGK
jgi:hypothetical protein